MRVLPHPAPRQMVSLHAGGEVSGRHPRKRISREKAEEPRPRHCPLLRPTVEPLLPDVHDVEAERRQARGVPPNPKVGTMPAQLPHQHPLLLRDRFMALVRGCGQAYALQTVEPVTSRCGTRRVCQARSSGSERDTRARPHAVAPTNGVPEDSRRRSTCTGRTHSPRARADGHQTPSSTVAVRAPSPS